VRFPEGGNPDNIEVLFRVAWMLETV